jgi:hypothetical protein
MQPLPVSLFAGPINKIRLLGDEKHETKKAFIEFETAVAAERSLACSGMLLGE